MWGQLSSTWSNTEVAQWGAPSCSRPQPGTDNGVRDGRSNWLVTPPPSWAVLLEHLVHSINRCSSSTAGIRSCNLATFSMRGNHFAYAATQGIKRPMWPLRVIQWRLTLMLMELDGYTESRENCSVSRLYWTPHQLESILIWGGALLAQPYHIPFRGTWRPWRESPPPWSRLRGGRSKAASRATLAHHWGLAALETGTSYSKRCEIVVTPMIVFFMITLHFFSICSVIKL